MRTGNKKTQNNDRQKDRKNGQEKWTGKKGQEK